MSKPIIYQVLPRLWGNTNPFPVKNGTLQQNGTGKFKDFDHAFFSHMKSLGISHIWYTGIIRHATQENTEGCQQSSPLWVKGKAGSPYAITDYYDVNPYLAENPDDRMAEFKDLVRRTHEAGMKVIIDFVPNHVARDYGNFSFRQDDLGRGDDKSVHWKDSNDFFYYPDRQLVLPIEKNGEKYEEFPAKASGNNYSPEPSVNDWYDTVKLNYCEYHTGTWDKMADIVRYWCSLGIDGFRCDMVELVPAEFFRWMISKVKSEFPDVIFIAEVYQKNNYQKYVREVGFDYLYDKSGLYDTLKAIVTKNVSDDYTPTEQWQSAKRITWNWQSLGDLQPHMLNFLENHDEQRFASEFFGKDAQNSFASLYVSLFFNTCPFMLYFGEEIGERGDDTEGMSGKDGRTSIFDWWTIDSVRRLNGTLHEENGLLSLKEETILSRYRKALKFAADDDAIQRGTTYDLGYCNSSSTGFNPDKHFAFLRHSDDETLLIVCNFGSSDSDMEISLPMHAFEWMDLPQNERLNSERPLKVHVPAMDGTIIQLTQSE